MDSQNGQVGRNILKTEHVVLGLEPGCQYHFRVTAVNISGAGPPSVPSKPAKCDELGLCLSLNPIHVGCLLTKTNCFYLLELLLALFNRSKIKYCYKEHILLTQYLFHDHKDHLFSSLLL